ncbi:gliding motility-associated ABC transporter ATP-binding subunit GldA [Galbibacter sp.]|uniref:gliding motility-associated ABC transporter ATP-binding subunit GldA n=1 Tax=Galbibacter sp. TaxID=2918471 RepID=UPI003A90B969
MSIEIKNISKSYDDKLALDNISFSIKKGEIVGLLGPNGAGKSTLMKILTTYLSPDKGSVLINDYSAVTQPMDIKRSIGYLPEHNPLHLDMYVREYLKYIACIYKVDKKQIEPVIQDCGLSDHANKKIDALSKGYRQRLGLAAALISNPEVLILDEPTTGLDPNQLIEIRNLIREAGKEKTILLSTHIMQEVEAICDRVIIIKQGQIVADKILKDLRASKEQIIEVEFDYRVENILLENLPKVVAVKNTVGFVYEITFNTDKDMRGSLFDFAHDNGLKTLQLNQKNKNLESLFIELTKA